MRSQLAVMATSGPGMFVLVCTLLSLSILKIMSKLPTLKINSETSCLQFSQIYLKKQEDVVSLGFLHEVARVPVAADSVFRTPVALAVPCPKAKCSLKVW